MDNAVSGYAVLFSSCATVLVTLINVFSNYKTAKNMQEHEIKLHKFDKATSIKIEILQNNYNLKSQYFADFIDTSLLCCYGSSPNIEKLTSAYAKLVSITDSVKDIDKVYDYFMIDDKSCIGDEDDCKLYIKSAIQQTVSSMSTELAEERAKIEALLQAVEK